MTVPNGRKSYLLKNLRLASGDSWPYWVHDYAVMVETLVCLMFPTERLKELADRCSISRTVATVIGQYLTPLSEILK